MFDSMIRNLQADIALLQRFVQLRQGAGLNDMQRMVESLAIRIFRAIHKIDLKNKNLLQVNFPAIDLADDRKKVAVQVTVNANPTKIRKTVKLFEQNNLQRVYKQLYILGFCKASCMTVVPSYCTVIDMNYVINQLVDNNDEQDLQEILDGVRRHQDYSSLHPWHDVDCLRIVLNCIDRNAIKHQMSCEGSISDMSKGLKEISELIGKGTINGKTKSKSLDDFHDSQIIEFLKVVKDDISGILAIVNKSKHPNTDFVYLNQKDMMNIDLLKGQISRRATDIAKTYNIPLEVIVKV